MPRPAASEPASLIIGRSAPTETLRRLVLTMASSSSTALVTGESGTGKELVAQALHRFGQRADRAFVPINCGAIPRELLESELFGHRKGAFTGAVSDRAGRFELAHGGTLFLDEIGDLPLDMQVKILRVLQERVILPVGASREVPVDVRVVAATHRNLEEEVAAGRFREDLYYRLNVLPISTAPLRERPDDVPDLLSFYASRHAMPGARPVQFTEGFMALLRDYRWPGNVRELSNLVDRFSTLFPGQLLAEDSVPSCMLPRELAQLQGQALASRAREPVVPLSVLMGHVEAVSLPLSTTPAAANALALTHGSADVQAAWDQLFSPQEAGIEPVPVFVPGETAQHASNDEINEVEQAVLLAQGIQTLPPEGLSLKEHLVQIERSLIEQALARAQGNVSQTARLLQLQRTTLIEKMNKYALRANA